MKNKNKVISRICIGWLLACLFSISTAFAASVTGGAMTINLDRDLLASAFTHNHDPNRPSFYLEEYFSATEAVNRSPNQLLNDHIVPGTAEIPASGLEFTVNPSTTSGFNVATNFSFSPTDLPATASGAIGLGGAMRYRLNIPFTLDPITGEEIGNRAITGYFSLEYDQNRVDNSFGHSGWALYNHHSFRTDMFDLDNVIMQLTENSLSLGGDLALASGFNHMGGQEGSIVGNFSFQTTVVPLPATFWLMGSGLGLLQLFNRKIKA